MKLAALAHTIGARLIGDGDIEVERVRAVDEAGARDLAFAAAPRELRAAYTCAAGALLVDESFAAEHAHELPCAVLASSSSPKALALAIDALHPQAPALRGIDARAVVHESALVHDDAYVGPLAVIGASAVVHARAQVGPLAYVGDGVVVGLDARIGPGAVLMPNTRIGERAIVGPGSVIGDEGFVFAPDGAGNVRVRHVAGVRIGDDVDIGANSTIDRGMLRDTRVGRGTVIDNLVQVAHDVTVGEDAVIIAQVGIAGDAHIGDGAVLAGQAGVKDHVRVGKRARVAGQAGVTRDVDDGAAVSGMPAIPHMTWLRAMARLARLDELERRVRSLEARATVTATAKEKS